jgi:hypothetical protein
VEAAKFKKLEEYASTLGKKGGEEEKSGDFAGAIPTYLKLVDVLLILADASPSYAYWVKCTTNAENYQKKIRQLIAKASLQMENNYEQPQKQQPPSAPTVSK